jgi:hypothetical protein
MWSIPEILSFSYQLNPILWVLIFQIPLLKIHYIRKTTSQPPETVPTTTELYIASVLIWILQIFVETGVIFVFGLFTENGSSLYFGTWNAVAFVSLQRLFRQVVATWGLHLALIALLEFAVPSLHAMHFHPGATMLHMHARYRNFIHFLPLIASTQPSPKGPPATSARAAPRQRAASLSTRNKTSSNEVKFERSRAETLENGRRVLDWSLVIDPVAMSEMKETLGPPGGFGELGFCVQSDNVKFECMGPATNFSLTFRVLTVDEKANGNSAIIKPRKKKRRDNT